MLNVDDEPTTYVVKVCLIVAIIFTYPMQLFPVTEIFDYLLFNKASEGLFDFKVRKRESINNKFLL